MSELDIILRVAIPTVALVLLFLAWPILKSWDA